MQVHNPTVIAQQQRVRLGRTCIGHILALLLRTCVNSAEHEVADLCPLMRRAGGTAGFKAAEQLVTLLLSAGVWTADSAATAAIPNGRAAPTADSAAERAAAVAAPDAAAPASGHSRVAEAPPVHLVGFSKGGVILNQLLTEVSELYQPSARAPSRPPRAAPPRFDAAPAAVDAALSTGEADSSAGAEPVLAAAPAEAAALLRAVASVHYVDAGVNSRGAYLTDPQVPLGTALLSGILSTASNRPTYTTFMSIY